MTSSETDHRRGPRRRGAELEEAILRAAREGLIEVGYAALTMDWIASRARTSKAALYRRWNNRAELVIHAHRELVRSLVPAPDTGSFITDMRKLLRSFAAMLETEFGDLLRGVIAEVARNPELAAEVRRQILDRDPGLIDELYERGIARGEVRPELRGTRAVTVPMDLLRNEFLTLGPPISDAVIDDILDNIYFPLVCTNQPTR